MDTNNQTSSERSVKGNCESCMMPFSKDVGVRENDKYCSFCFKNGKLCYEGSDLKEFQRVSKESMIKGGMSPLKAWFFTKLIAFAPRWKK
jgi:hypothetical protein